MSSLQEQAAALFGLELSPAQVAAFDTYYNLLAEWNNHTNLTAIIEEEAVQVRHFLDSLSLAKVLILRDGLKLIDVGTGAGFPGLALAIAYPQLRVTLLESTGKKTKFLDHVISTLNLPNARTLNARAEDAGHISHHRAHYDVVVARAVARMPALVEYLLPLARVGGQCIAMKGETAQQETEDARHALQILGGRLNRIEEIHLPDVEHKHFLVIIDKTDATPAPYPRNPGIPTRKPL